MEPGTLVPPQADKKIWLETLPERNTDVKTEMIAGLTTFMTMRYIIFIHPSIRPTPESRKTRVGRHHLFQRDWHTLLMGLGAHFPVAVARKWDCAFFAYTPVLREGLGCQTALDAVFISGIVFSILSVTGIRQKPIGAIPVYAHSASA